MNTDDIKDKYILETGKPVFAWEEDDEPIYYNKYVEWLEKELLKLQKQVNIKHLKRK